MSWRPCYKRGMRCGTSLALCLAIAVACTGGSADSPPSSEAESGRELIERILSEPLPADPGPDVGGRALQDEVFADDVVTFAEYERAVAAYAQCLRDEGFELLGPYEGGQFSPGFDPRMFLSVSVRIPDDAAEARFDEVGSRCQMQWSYHIELVWEAQNAPSEEAVQEWLEQAWTCGRDRGVEVSDPPTVHEAMLAVTAGCTPWEDG